MKINQCERIQFALTWQSHYTVWIVWLFCKNTAIVVIVSHRRHEINQHCCVLMDQECQRSARAEFHSLLRSIPNKRIWDPITRGEIKLLLPGRTAQSDKIHKDLSSFVYWLALSHIAYHPPSPFPYCCGELCDKLSLFQGAEDRSHSVSAVTLPCNFSVAEERGG